MNDTVIYDRAILAIDPEYDYTITTTPKHSRPRRDYPLFKAVGFENMHSGKRQGFPFLETLLHLSKPEQDFMILVLRRLDSQDNVALIHEEELPTWDAAKRSRVYSKLKKKGLIKRLNKRQYMLNPNAMFNPKTYADLQATWEKL